MKLLGLFLYVTVFFCGCHHRASIKMNEGHRYIGVIEGGDAENIYIEPEFAAEPIAIPRDEIQALSHPGKGAIIVGSIATGAGVLLAFYGLLLRSLLQSSANNEAEFVSVFVLGPAALAGGIGIFSIVWGVSTNNASHERAKNYSPKFSVVPRIKVDGNQGGGLSLRFAF